MSYEPLFETLTNRAHELDLLMEHFGAGQRIATITGPRGIGKTALAYTFSSLAERNNIFPGGTHTFTLRALQFSAQHLQIFQEDFTVSHAQRSLLLVDDYEMASPEMRAWLSTLLQKLPLLSVIFCGNEIPSDLKSSLNVFLRGFDQASWFDLINKHLAFSEASPETRQRLFDFVQGNPGLTAIANGTIREGLFTLENFLDGLASFKRAGILGPDGMPLKAVPEIVRINVEETNASLLARLSRNPESIRELPSRKFEEIVAEILSGQGYETELTPASKDGGFDMYAAKKDGLGSFLYLVECKRYNPPNKVGVQVVRSLHGVVQQQQANAGIVVTSSFFTKGAREFQETLPYKIQLRDYLVLRKWLGVDD